MSRSVPGAARGRRRFLSFCTDVLMGLIGLLVAVPAVAYVLAPLRRRRGAEGGEGRFEDLGPLGDLAIGEWRLLSLEVIHQDGWKRAPSRHSVWVRRQAEGDQAISVLSPICPHLGCPINWQPVQSQFLCPCHGGLFDVQGRHVGGPPPRSMDALEFQIREGRLWVRWQDFKIGVRERVVVGA